MRHAKKLLRFLDQEKLSISPLLILTHDYPDPDALASAFALQYLAEKSFGIQSRIAYGGIIGRTENREMVDILRIPAHKLTARNFKKYKHVALVDTQPAFENNSFPSNQRATIVIDQHPSVKKPVADCVLIDTDCGATSIILSQALLIKGVEIPMKIATALVYGIQTDTLNLYRSRRADVIKTYTEILPRCDMRALARIQNPSRSRRFFLTLSQGIQNAMVRRGVIISHLGEVENPDLVSQVAEFLLTYKRSNWSFCTGRYHGKLHVSLRAVKTDAKAGEVLRDIFVNRGKAGGHGAIAGGSMEIDHDDNDKEWDEVELALVQRLVKRLRLPLKTQFYYPFRLN